MSFLEDLFRVAIYNKASDLLIVAGFPAHIRVNGEMLPVGEDILTSDDTRELLFALLSEHQKTIFEREKAVDLSYCFIEEQEDAVREYRFRINVYQQRGSVSGAFRLIPDAIPSIDQLGLPDVLKRLALLPQGLILVTGPTGHGKSTTLASMLDLINEQTTKHVITVEDPIEYLHRAKRSVIEQRELGGDTPSFQSALKYVLRQDPDVILVGEMRDLETVSCVLSAAETGHLVLGTLHTNDAIQSIERIVDIFPSGQQTQIRTQLSLCLTAVVSQRLLQRLDVDGRVVVCEVMLNNSAIANLIREGKTHQILSVMQTHSKEEMISFDHSLQNLYNRGMITERDARMYMRKPERLRSIHI